MRRIGLTDQVGDITEVIVHMSPAEWHTMQSLMSAVEGNVPDDFDYNRWEPIELSPTFRAIREWFSLRFKINRLQMHIDDLREALEHFE